LHPATRKVVHAEDVNGDAYAIFATDAALAVVSWRDEESGSVSTL
jgi:hypothetical protein